MAEEKPFFRSCEGQIRFPALPSTFQVHGSSPLGCNIGGKKLRSGKNSKGKSRISSEFNESDSKKRKNREISSKNTISTEMGKSYVFLGKNLFETSLFVSSPLDVLISREFSFLRDYRKKTKKKNRRKERETRFLIKARYDPSAVRGTSATRICPMNYDRPGK